jgi:hypothetical protein
MLTIDGVKVKSGAAFMKKDGGRTKFVVGTVHRNGDVTYVAEKNFKRFNGSVGGGSVRVTGEVFKTAIFKSFVKGQREILLEKAQKRREEEIRRESVNNAHGEALRLDILMDAARGVSADELLSRMEAIIASEKEKSWEDGYDEGKSLSEDYSYNSCSYCV